MKHVYNKSEKTIQSRIKISAHKRCKKLSEEYNVKVQEIIDKGIHLFCDYLDEIRSNVYQSEDSILLEAEDIERVLNDKFHEL